MGSGVQGQVDLLAGCSWMVRTTKSIGGLVVLTISPHPETECMRKGRFDDFLITFLFLYDLLPTLLLHYRR